MYPSIAMALNLGPDTTRIVGYEDCVIVEGEMDVLALHEAGIKNVISVPNGATLNNNNLDYLDNCIDYFDDKQRIVLAVDADEPGQMLKQELVRRLGAEVCYLVDFNGEKDANDYLLEHGAELLRNAIHSARPVPLENVSTLKDVQKWFKVYCAGGMGAKPMVGNLLFDFIPDTKVYHVTRALKTMFDKHGNRRSKFSSRLKFLWKKWKQQSLSQQLKD